MSESVNCTFNFEFVNYQAFFSYEFNALEMSEMITIVLNVMTVIMANTCGEIHAMPKTLEQILTQRAYVVMNTSASRKVQTLGNARTMNTALPRHHTKWHSVQRRATPTVKAGQISKIVKKIRRPKKKSAECTCPQDVAPVKKCKLIVGGKVIKLFKFLCDL